MAPFSLAKFFGQTQSLLGCWLLLGAGLRLWNLGAKPPWTDEFATLLYARGDDYSGIPINEIISAEMLLEPLKGYSHEGLGEVAQLLLTQNNHPPLYFLLVNGWQRLFPLDAQGYISIDGVRLLSVIFGVFGIWAMYRVAKLGFGSETIAQLSAALMAFSPFGVYLAQEARHYTLIILVAIAALGFCLQAINWIVAGKEFPKLWLIGWILICCFGLLIHYFFVLTLLAQAIALGWWLWRSGHRATRQQLRGLLAVMVGVMAFGLIWKTQVLPNRFGTTMTDWIRLDYRDWFDLISPIFQGCAALATMVLLLPVAVNFLPVVIVSGAIMGVAGVKIFRLWRQGMGHQFTNLSTQSSLFFLQRMAIATWFLMAVLIYGFGIDITRGARYSFIYFPVILLLIAAGLSPLWQGAFSPKFLGIETIFSRFLQGGKQAIAAILCLCFFSGVTVANNWGYPKPYQPAPIIETIAAQGQPALILTPYDSTVQIGEMMGIAWENYRQRSTTPLYFGFIPQSTAIAPPPNLEALLSTMPQPTFTLWTVNFFEPFVLKHCQFRERFSQSGYYGDRHQCQYP